MRIQFEIKERLDDIIWEILHSEKWHPLIKEEKEGLKRLTLKDPYFESEAQVEIWKDEIHLKTAWSNYTYRIYNRGNSVWCEYVGAYRGLLEQSLLPRITPKDNLLDSEDTAAHSSYSMEQPKVVYDDFIKDSALMPPPL